MIESGSGRRVQGPALPGSNQFFGGAYGGIPGGATDVQGSRASHGRQTREQCHQVSASESGGHHINTAAGDAGINGNVKSCNHFFDGGSDLPSNNVAIGLEGHDES